MGKTQAGPPIAGIAHGALSAFIVAVALFAGLIVLAPSAQAALHNPIPADASGDPNDMFFDNQSLWAYFTADLAGGRICVVADTDDLDSIGCDSPAMGNTTTIAASIGTQYVLVKKQPLTPGTFRLLVENSLHEPLETSIPFTVLVCEGCDPNPDQAIVDAYKASAAQNRDRMGGVCEMQGVLEKVAGKAIGMRGINKKVEVKATATLSYSTPSFTLALSGSTTLLSFTVQDPLTVNINKALDILKDVSCGARKMFHDMANDPPDPDYTEVAIPDPLDIETLNPDTLDSAVRSVDLVRAYIEASRIGFERYQAAAAAGDTASQILQLRAAGNNALDLSHELVVSAEALRAWSDEAATDSELAGTVLTSADAADLALLYDRVATTGFTQDEVDQFHELGYTDDEIADIRTHATVGLDDMSLDTSYPEALDAVAAGIESEVESVADFASEMLADAARLEATVGGNQHPAVTNDSLTTSLDTPKSVDVLANDSDPDGDPLSVSASTHGAHGSVSCSTAGACTYTPSGGFTGSDSFTYDVSDGHGGTATGTVSVTVESGSPTNHDPSAGNDSISTVEGTPGSTNVLLNDVDPDGDTLSVSSNTQGVNGSVSCGGVGQCTYLPNAGFTGSDSFDYTADDGKGGTATATVTVTVAEATPGNTDPVATDDTVEVVVSKSTYVHPLLNDSDPDFDPLYLVSNTSPVHGDLTCTASYYCFYEPNSGYVGPDAFDYVLSDGRGGLDTGTVSITVIPNRAPIVKDDSLTTRRDAPAPRVVYVLSNDHDEDGDQLVLSDFTPADHGTVACPENGACSYTPDPGYVGEDSFGYTASDHMGNFTDAVVTITVTENTDPSANDDGLTVTTGVVTFVPVLSNDTDADNDELIFVGATDATHGTATCDPGGGCSYTSDPGFVGSDGFEYSISDGTATDSAHVSIEVQPPCFPARCVDNGTVLLAINPEGHLNATNTIGSKGEGQPRGLTYLPTGNEATAPGCLCEGWGAADAGTGITGFANVSSDGGAHGMSVESFEGTDSTAVSVVTIQDTLRVTHDYHPSRETEDLYEVTVTLENLTDQELSDVRYRRVMDWDIQPTPFSEFVTIDGGTASKLLFDSNNGFESANPLGARSDIGFTGNFTDKGPADHGALFDFGFGALSAGDSTSFRIFYGAAPDEETAQQDVNAVGAEVFSFGQPNTPDGPTLGTPNTFIFAFGKVGGTPVFTPDAVDDEATTDEGVAAVIDVLANDSDPNGDPLTVTTLAPTAAHGTVSCTAVDGCTYTPDPEFSGEDSFEYSITDGNGGADSATVRVSVGGGNGDPTATDDSMTTDQDTPGKVDVLANDTDSDADTLTVTSPTPSAGHGTVSCTTAGVCTYTPNGGYSGPDSFDYAISDGNGGTDQATVSVTVSHVNHRPVANDDSLTTDEDTAKSLNVLTNDTDPDADTLTVTSPTPSAGHGTVSCTTAGVCTYTPNGGYSGPDSFDYAISDGNGGTDQATVSVTVSHVNHRPVANDDSLTTDEDTAKSLNVLTNDTDPDADTLTVTSPTPSAGHGTVSCTTAGVCTYTPNGGYSGPDSFDYAISDGHGGTASATVSVTVTPKNDAPRLRLDADSAVAQYSDPLGPVGLSATDLDAGDNLALSAAGLPASVGLTDNHDRTGSIGGLVTVGAGSYPAQVSVTDGALADSKPFAITVSPESATVDYTGDSTVALPTGATTATVRIAATAVQESDGHLGDITKARVFFDLYKGSNMTMSSPDLTLGPFAPDTTGLASTTASLAEDTWTVVVRFQATNSFFSGPDSQAAIVTVYAPAPGKVTGGGWITDPSFRNIPVAISAQSPRGNFGFVVQTKGGTTSVRGNVVYVFRGANGKDYVMKSSNWSGGSLSINPDGRVATAKGKATVIVRNSQTGKRSTISNLTFQLDLTDSGAGGRDDRFALSIWDGTTLWHQSGTSTSPISLGGGNISIHKK